MSHRSVQCMSNFHVPVPADFTKAKGTWMMEKKHLSRLTNCTYLSCSGPELGSEISAKAQLSRSHSLRELYLHNTSWCHAKVCHRPAMSGSKSVPSKPRMPSHVHRALGTAAWTPEQHWEAPVAGQIEHVEFLCSWSKAYCFTLGFSWCWQLWHNCGVHHWQRLSQLAGSSIFCLSSSSSSSSSSSLSSSSSAAAAAGQAKPHHLSTHVQ